MNTTMRKWIVAGILLLALLVLAAGTLLIARFFFPSAWGGPGGMMGRGWFGDRGYENRSFDSNGEQIYFTGTSRSGPAITARMQDDLDMPMMRERLACVDCHGENGEGGTLRMMMETIEVPNIQYKHMTEEEHGEGEEEHPPYTEETIQQAITEGVNPAGEPLEWPMPQWDMSEAQVSDLIAYLKTLR